MSFVLPDIPIILVVNGQLPGVSIILTVVGFSIIVGAWGKVK